MLIWVIYSAMPVPDCFLSQPTHPSYKGYFSRTTSAICQHPSNNEETGIETHNGKFQFSKMKDTSEFDNPFYTQ